MIGERIGTYRILRQLGEGGMGTVWLAEHVMIGRRAAIKMLHPHISSQPDLTQRFFQEAKAAAAVQDAGIVQIFDFGQHTDGRAYLVMELLEGESLEQRLSKLGRLALGEALRILEQVASSIGAVHHRGIVHRDLKPDNIYLVRDVAANGGERAKILDFGIAKIANAGLKTMTSVVMGTPMFMSPEQCRGAGNVDGRSDVYALGCVLFLVLTGRPPFFAEGVGDLIAMHLREPAPAPSSLVPGIPPGVDALVLRCLEKDAARRFAHAGALAEALAAQLAQLPGASQPMPAAHALAPALAATSPMPVLPGPLGPPGSSGPPGRLGPTTTLTSTSGSRTARPPGGRSPLMGWLYVGIAAAAISMSAAVITTLRDASPAALPVTNVTLPTALPPASPPREASGTSPTGPTSPTSPTDRAAAGAPAASASAALAAPSAPAALAAPSAPAAPAALSAPSAPAAPSAPPDPSAPSAPAPASAATAPPAPAPSPAEAKALPRPAVSSKPRAAAPDLGTIGGTPAGDAGEGAASATSCAAQRAALDAFIKRSYQAPPAAALKQARALPTGCLDKNQRYRFALVAISLACKGGDRAAAQRFLALGADASLRDRCPALLR